MHVKIYKPGVLPEDQWAGEIPSMDLAGIFRYFNRVELDDSDRLKKIGYNHPSLSMGDVVLVEGFAFECTPFGWRRMEELDATEQELRCA